MTTPNVVLYTRQGCHLCHAAEKVLAKYGLRTQLIDIDEQPALRSKFGDCVPVIEINRRIRFRGHVNEVLLRRILRSENTA